MTSEPRCRCRGRSGARKTAYRNKRQAVTVAIRRGWTPTTYHCPTSQAIHLTHENHTR